MNGFEKQVRKALIDKDMTIRDLATSLEVSQAYVYDILKGNRQGGKKKQKIAELLGLEEVLLSANP